jgi:hypothetical protein
MKGISYPERHRFPASQNTHLGKAYRQRVGSKRHDGLAMILCHLLGKHCSSCTVFTQG